jgi:hypothetical protein
MSISGRSSHGIGLWNAWHTVFLLFRSFQNDIYEVMRMVTRALPDAMLQGYIEEPFRGQLKCLMFLSQTQCALHYLCANL